MAAEESVKPVGALASRTNSIAQMYVLVEKNVSTVTTVNSAMMRTTPPVVGKKVPQAIPYYGCDKFLEKFF